MWEKLKDGILKCPITYLPALFQVLVIRCLMESVFVKDGMEKVIVAAKNLLSDNKTPITYPEKASFVGFVWVCPHCAETVPKRGTEYDNGKWICARCRMGVVPVAVYREHIENPKAIPALVQCAKVLRQWHGKEVFDIYYQHAPEMAVVRDELPYEDFIGAAGTE
jgi:hypothetical protein